MLRDRQARRNGAHVVRRHRLGGRRRRGVDPGTVAEDSEGDEHHIDVRAGEALFDRRLMRGRVPRVEWERAHGGCACCGELLHLLDDRGRVTYSQQDSAASMRHQLAHRRVSDLRATAEHECGLHGTESVSHQASA
jgi:hypothetical protein